MIVDKKINETEYGLDIDFSYEDCIKNNIRLSIINSNISEVKKLTDSNIKLIESYINESLVWLINAKRLKKITSTVSKVNNIRIKINVVAETIYNSIQYELFYSMVGVW